MGHPLGVFPMVAGVLMVVTPIMFQRAEEQFATRISEKMSESIEYISEQEWRIIKERVAAKFEERLQERSGIAGAIDRELSGRNRPRRMEIFRLCHHLDCGIHEFEDGTVVDMAPASDSSKAYSVVFPDGDHDEFIAFDDGNIMGAFFA